MIFLRTELFHFQMILSYMLHSWWLLSISPYGTIGTGTHGRFKVKATILQGAYYSVERNEALPQNAYLAERIKIIPKQLLGLVVIELLYRDVS